MPQPPAIYESAVKEQIFPVKAWRKNIIFFTTILLLKNTNKTGGKIINSGEEGNERNYYL
jgi:hypothetical protein